MRPRFAVLVGSLLVAVSLSACRDADRVTGPITDPTPEPPAAASLSGRLLDHATQAPIAGASIRFGDATATSGADGRFLLTDLPAGTETLRCSAVGFEDLEQSVKVPGAGVTLVLFLRRQELLAFDDFALYVPASLPAVRGVVLALGGPDTRAFASGGSFGAPVAEVEAALQSLGTRFRELAASEGLAILGTSHAALANGSASDDLLMAALAEAAAMSARPEIEAAPLLLYGLSGGAPQASGFAARHSARTIGLFLKVPAGFETLGGAEALSIPTFVALAGDDAFVDNPALVAGFAENRGAGALWALATEQAVPHHSLTPRHRELTLSWMSDVLAQRLVGSAGQLIAMTEASGWLGDPATGDVATPDHFVGDPGAASWLPSWEVAGRWDDFARATGPAASTLKLSPDSLELRAGWVGFLVVGVRDHTGAPVWDPAVTFASDREDVAYAGIRFCNWYCESAVGDVAGVSEGVATLTATYEQGHATVTVTVRPAVTFEVDPAEATIPVGGTVDLTVRIVEEGGVVVTDPEFAIEWYRCAACWGSPSSTFTVGEAVVDGGGTHYRVTGIAAGRDEIFFGPTGFAGTGGRSVITVQ